MPESGLEQKDANLERVEAEEPKPSAVDPEQSGASPECPQTAGNKKGRALFVTGCVFLGLQLLSAVLTGVCIFYVISTMKIPNNSVVGAFAGLLAYVAIVAIWIVLGCLVFILFGLLCILFSHLSVKQGMGKAAKSVRRTSTVLTVVCFAILVLGLVFKK